MSQTLRRSGYATRPAPCPPAPQLAVSYRTVVRPTARPSPGSPGRGASGHAPAGARARH